jgi:hypothetical protein
MMDTVHLRGHHQQAEPFVNAQWIANIPMIKHGGSVQENLKDRDGQWKRPDKKDDGHLDSHRQDDFDRMKANPSGYVEVHVRMMNHVEAPEEGNGMKHDVLNIYREVEDQHTKAYMVPEWESKLIQYPPTPLSS